MKAYMDEVRYEKGGTEVHLVKQCDGPVETLVKNYASKFSRYFIRGRRERGNKVLNEALYEIIRIRRFRKEILLPGGPAH